ncbi:MAG: hypothetical protein WCT05_16625 [Lentisphaeria bacterium]
MPHVGHGIGFSSEWIKHHALNDFEGSFTSKIVAGAFDRTPIRAGAMDSDDQDRLLWALVARVSSSLLYWLGLLGDHEF